MKRVIVIFGVFILSLQLFSQKVPVTVTRDNIIADKYWQVLDENYGIVFQGSQYFSSDTIQFSLETNKRYFFYCSVTAVPGDTVDLYTVILDNEPLIKVRSDAGDGDHFFRFFTGTRSLQTKITGGSDALISEFPWQVFLTAGDQVCGGSIISDIWIVTAAHCVLTSSGATVSPSQVTAIAGATNPYNPSEGELYEALQVIVHEAYNDNTNENDIALVRLRNPVDNAPARPIKMVTSQDVSYGATDPGVMTWVTGWGLSSLSPEVFPSTLQKVQLPIITIAQASIVWNNIPPNVIMAGYRNGNRDACSGDSGGPMVVPVLGEYKLAGIVSWGSPQCNTYGAYTEISKFGTWIRAHTGIPALLTPPAPTGDTIICQGSDPESYSVGNTPGITSYEWRLFPSAAGSVSGTATSATVNWNSSFTGFVDLIFRVTSGGELSDWSRLSIRVVENTEIMRLSADTTVCQGEPLTLFVEAEGYNLRYDWYRNQALYQQDTGSSIFINSLRPEDAGIYHVEVSGECGTIRSGPISLTILPLTRITSVSPDASIELGTDQVIEVAATGHNLSYQWQRDSIPIPAATSPQLIINDADATDIGNYIVTVTGTCSVEKSDSVYLFVEGNPGSGGPDVLLWPNLVTASFNIAVNGDDSYNVLIYNTRGQLVAEYSNLRYQNRIDISHLSGGVYIVTVYNRQFRKSIRLVRV